MCKFKNYPDTFHDKWKYPTKSFGCIASSILPSISLTPQLNLFPTIIRDISHFSRFYCYYCYYIIHVSPHLPFFQLPTLYSIFTISFFFLFIYLFVRIFVQKQQRRIDYQYFFSSSWNGQKRKMATLLLSFFNDRSNETIVIQYLENFIVNEY